MKQWERERIDRLEKRVAELEWKNFEHSLFVFRLTMYGLTAAFVVLALVSIAIGASNSAPG